MESVILRQGADLPGFRRAVRDLIARDVAPQDVLWTTGEMSELFAASATHAASPVALPRAAAELIDQVICHRDPDRFALAYTLIWRILHGERALLEVQSDPVVHRLERCAKAIRRDLHKMHAFLRFRRLEMPGGERFIAWFEPDNYIVEATANFFVERFRGMIWSILTPVGSLHWDHAHLIIGPPGDKTKLPDGDGFEAGWVQYYESTFNPTRVNPSLMRKEMPMKYWEHMPEAKSIKTLIKQAPERVDAMIRQEAAMPIKRNPDKAVAAMAGQNPKTLEDLNRIIAASEPLVPGATRAVLGEGPINAAIAFVGEQPGDQEDLAGRPFIGPAGQLLDGALQKAGIDRRSVYVTNAVKHFKFEQRGKIRLHQKPTAGEIKHYRWWLMQELRFVKPGLVVALGASAAQALMGKAVTITQARGGAKFDDFAGYVTVHPSYLLRLPDENAKRLAYEAFLSDLKRIADLSQREQSH